MKIYTFLMLSLWIIASAYEMGDQRKRIKLLEHRVALMRWDVDDHNDRLKRFEEGD